MGHKVVVAREAAFFDVDYTVLTVNSGTEWVRHLRRTGQMPLSHLARSILWLIEYRAGLLDFDAMTERAIVPYKGRLESEIRDEVRIWYRAHVRDKISRGALDALAEHRAKGRALVLLTSATQFMVEELAADLDVPHVLCTEVDVVEGRIVGSVRSPACYGPGKVFHAEAFAEREGIDLGASWFYSDSYTDRPMLERVGRPQVVNPDPRLARHARKVGWPVVQWREPAPATALSRVARDPG